MLGFLCQHTHGQVEKIPVGRRVSGKGERGRKEGRRLPGLVFGTGQA